MRLLSPILVALLLTPLPLAAQAQDPPLPQSRQVDTGAAQTPPVPLPKPRPEPDAAEPGAAEPVEDGKAEPVEGETTQAAGPTEPPPPPREYQSGCGAVISGAVEAELLKPIQEGQCGIQTPWSVTAVQVNGRMIPLSQAPTTSCEMASSLPGWLSEIDGYVFAHENLHIEEVVVGTGYMCRKVNGAQSGNLSFHAFANALDIVGFRLSDGRTVAVESGWGDALSNDGRLLRFAHDSACSRFMTTLGPEANAEHHDHLHIDMGCHGKSCAARLCE